MARFDPCFARSQNYELTEQRSGASNIQIDVSAIVLRLHIRFNTIEVVQCTKSTAREQSRHTSGEPSRVPFVAMNAHLHSAELSTYVIKVSRQSRESNSRTQHH